MSLINKMLVDLEARKDAPGSAIPVKPIYDDLRPSMGAPSPRRIAPAAVLVIGIALGVGGFFAWRSGYVEIPATPSPVAAPAVPTAPTPNPVRVDAVASRATEVAPTPHEVAPPIGLEAPAQAAEPLPATVNPETAAPPVMAVSPVAVVPSPVVAKQVVNAPASKAKPTVTAPSKREAEPTPAAEVSVIDKKERVQTPEQKAENTYRAALAQLKQRQFTQAEPKLRAALNEYPGHIKARELLAGLLLETGRWSEATQVLAQGLEDTASHYAFAHLLARIYIEHGMEAKALATLEAAQGYAQRDADYRAFLATLYQRAGRHAEATDGYRTALAVRPAEAKWWLGLGISLEAERNWAAAAEAYARAQAAGGLTPTLKRYIDERLQAVKAHQ